MGSKIREAFLKYFEKHGHKRVKSSSLIPQNDPTLFFTNAGMVQFKDTFTGEEKRAYKRATSSQKCMRVSGKHNDLENVGHTARHHTFFEMLGNFSFGDYFKKEAIAFGWEFLTKEMKLDPNNLYVTVFNDDDEAEKLWKKHVPANRIFRLGEKDNFWAMGETGPCGPCSEIIWDFKPESGEVKKEELDSDRFMEIWNLVFMQFERSNDGKLKKLAAPSIDTGMGLERLSAVIEGVHSNWETDLFVPIINEAAAITGVKVGSSKETDIALRVIADHIRSSVFLIGDGVLPSNEGRGYVLRRIIRRAIRYGKRLGRNNPFMTELVPVVIDEMGAAYPELVTHEKFIKKVIFSEDERFYSTLDRGLELLKEEMFKSKKKMISGEIAFQLYDTFGFPLDVTEQIAKENGFEVDEKGFNLNMEKQRERARASWKGSGSEAVDNVYKSLASEKLKTQFVGYNSETSQAKVLAILKDGKRVQNALAGDEIGFVTDETPFFGESGGQSGDSGMAVSQGMEVEIADAKKPLPDIIVHLGKVKRGELKVGENITLAIDGELRQGIMCNHSATHLLHKALREVLGEHVKQAGSLVKSERLRFDFSHFQPMTEEEIKDVERHVNVAIRANYPVIINELKYDDAVKYGALAFFGEKYGDVVRMVDMSGFSRELCGGCHIGATGEIGLFKIISESSVAAGVRRIEALTQISACEYVDALEKKIEEVAKILKSGPDEIIDRTNKLLGEIARLEKELKKERSKAAGGSASDLLNQAREVNGIKILSAKVDVADRDVLSGLAERYRDKLGKSVVVLFTELNNTVAIVVAVSKDLTPAVNAGKIAFALSQAVGGKGGGRPDFAQGGGTDISKLDEAVKLVYEIVKREA